MANGGGVPVSTNDPRGTALVSAANAGKQSAYQIRGLARLAGFNEEQAIIATAVALAESGGVPNIKGDLALQTSVWGPSYGLWQIRTVKAETGRGTPRDINWLAASLGNQARAAYRISNSGTNFRPWTMYTNGRYRAFLDDARNAKPDGGPINNAISGAIESGAAIQNLASTVRRAVAALTQGGIWIRVGLVIVGTLLFITALGFIAADIGLSSNIGSKVIKRIPL